MTPDDIILSARYRLNDFAHVEYLDAEFMDYINTVLRFINKFLIEKDSDYVKSVTTLDTSSGSASLPSDFMAIWYVKDEDGNLVKMKDPSKASYSSSYYFPNYSVVNPNNYYYVLGDTIYSNLDSLELGYYKSLGEMTALGDDIPLPEYFRNIIVEMVCIIALNRNEFSVTTEEFLMQQFSKSLASLIINHGFAHKENVRRVMPFVV